MFAISRRARWVMLMIFVSSCSFSAIQHVAARADMVAPPSFGIGFLAATSGSVAWLLATRIMQALAMQTIVLLGLRTMFRHCTNLPSAILLGFAALLQLKTASQVIQAWGLFHDVWHVRDMVNATEVLVEAILIALIVTRKPWEGGVSLSGPNTRSPTLAL
jgi:hypothetical protein